MSTPVVVTPMEFSATTVYFRNVSIFTCRKCRTASMIPSPLSCAQQRLQSTPGGNLTCLSLSTSSSVYVAFLGVRGTYHQHCEEVKFLIHLFTSLCELNTSTNLKLRSSLNNRANKNVIMSQLPVIMSQLPASVTCL